MHDVADTGREAVALDALVRSDLDVVLEIERVSFSSPWSLGTFALELAKPETIAIAARSPSGLAGYLICTRYADAWHLMNVAVEPGHRRRGIGSMLVCELIRRLGERARITLEVRESNRGALEMYERLGFRAAGRRPAYYPDNGEAAVLMWLNPPRGEW